MKTLSESTAATDLYRRDAGADFVVVAPTNLSVTPTWSWILDPNDRLPINQVIADAPSEQYVVKERDTARSEITVSTVELEQRQALMLKQGVAEALTDLATTWGMSWVDIAKIVGVSVPALRKWRMGQAKPKRNHWSRIAYISALLWAMRASGVVEPAGRLSVRVVDSCYLTLRDVVVSAAADDTLAYVQGSLSGEGLLDRSVKDWRDRYRAQTETYIAADGERAMRIRGHRES